MENSHKKKIIQSTLGAVVGAIAILLLQHFFFSPPSFDKVIMNAASEINKSCPMMVDAETRLDNTIALPGNKFQYNYTLINYAFPELDLERVRNTIEPGLVNNVKTNPDLAVMRKNNVILSYSYRDKNGDFLFKITVGSDQYK